MVGGTRRTTDASVANEQLEHSSLVSVRNTTPRWLVWLSVDWSIVREPEVTGLIPGGAHT